MEQLKATPQPRKRFPYTCAAITKTTKMLCKHKAQIGRKYCPIHHNEPDY